MKSPFSVFPRLRGRAAAIGPFVLRHKILAGIAAAVVLGLGYHVYAAHKANATTTQYVLARASSQSIQSTITASGEVAANHQLDLAPKATGEVTGMYVSAGDTVKAGALIATIDSTDAQKSVRDARLSLESAQISYTQAITSANNSITNGTISLGTATVSGFDEVTSAESQLSTVLQGLNTVLLGTTDLPNSGGLPNLNAYTRLIGGVEPGAEAAREAAHASLLAAQQSYEASFSQYQSASRDASPQEVQQLLASVARSTATATQAVKDSQAFLQLVNTTIQNHDLLATPPSLSSQLVTVNGYASTISGTASSLAGAQSALTGAVQTQSSNAQSVNGTTPLAIQSAEITLAKARQALADAESDLADYVVRAPFAGTIAEVDVQKFDQASGKVATLITDEQYADISLNETDIESVRSGQKATLTFDAIDGLTIEGTVAQVNQIGTVSNGVTTYTVKVGFDTQDARIRPGMTVNASIVTASKDNALVVPSTAIKTQDGESYVEVAMMGNGASGEAGMASRGTATSTATRYARTASSTPSDPTASSSARTYTRAGASGGMTVGTDEVTVTRVPVTLGIIGDTITEIASGLSPGQLVVSQSLNASGTQTNTSSSGGLFGLFGSKSGTASTRTSTAGTGGSSARSSGTSGGGGFGGPPPGGF